MAWTIFTVTSTVWGALELSHNDQYLSTTKISFAEDDLENMERFSEGGTPAPTSFQLSPTLRFTTAHIPKDPSAGFVFGSNKEKCDILLATSRETGISGTQFAVTFNQESAAVIIKNLSRRLTKIQPQREGAFRLRTHRVLNEMEVTTIFLPGLELNVSKSWSHSEEIAPEYRQFLERVASSAPDLSLLRLQSSATTGTVASSAANPYTKDESLGSGMTGEVYKGRNRHTGIIIAIKTYWPHRKEANVEFSILSTLQHRSIIEIYEFIAPKQGPAQLIMEYAPFGNILSQIEAQNFEDHERRQIICQTLEGLAYTHRKGITHRNIKPSNILIFERQPIRIKLTGFGFSTRHEESMACYGDEKYRAPDISNPPYTNKVDIWSVGAIGFELWLGLPEYDASLWPDLVQLVAGNSALSFQDRSFFCKLLHPNRDLRLTAQECLRLNFATRQENNDKRLYTSGSIGSVESIPDTLVCNDSPEPPQSPVLADQQNQTSNSVSVHDMAGLASQNFDFQDVAAGPVDMIPERSYGFDWQEMTAGFADIADPANHNLDFQGAIASPADAAPKYPHGFVWKNTTAGFIDIADPANHNLDFQDVTAGPVNVATKHIHPYRDLIYPDQFDTHFDHDSRGALSHADRVSKWRPVIDHTKKKKLKPKVSYAPKKRESFMFFNHFLFRNTWVAYDTRRNTINIFHVMKALDQKESLLHSFSWQYMLVRRCVYNGKRGFRGTYVPYDDALLVCDLFYVGGEFGSAFEARSKPVDHH